MAQARRTKKKAKPSARENVRKRKISPPKARPVKKRPTFEKSKASKAKKPTKKPAKKPAKKPTKKPAKKGGKTPIRRGYGIAGGRKSAPPGRKPVKKKPVGPKLPKGFVQLGGGGAPLAPKGKKPTPRRWTIKLADRTVVALRKRVQEIVDGLERHDWAPEMRVHLYPDATIDGELRVPIFPERSKNDAITAMVLEMVRLARPLETFPAQYVSHGLLLGPTSNTRRRDSANPYKRYRGAYRLNVHWQGILDSEQNAKTMLEVMRNARKLHRVPPIGILVRWAWSADGLLHRGR